MTTITEILAEAFNRVKTEHGVTLSRVEFVDTCGVLGVSFKAAGSVKSCGLWQDATPPLAGQVYATPPSEIPNGATHFGTVADCENCFWKLDDHQLYMWSDDKWHFYFSLNPNATVATLTPLTNPT
jgi:hypothetical protein